jgi:hypothetical protein
VRDDVLTEEGGIEVTTDGIETDLQVEDDEDLLGL